MIKGVSHAHLGAICYHSEPSDVPFFLNQLLVGTFLPFSYSKQALVSLLLESSNKMQVRLLQIKVFRNMGK
jgi:hypothetical protein